MLQDEAIVGPIFFWASLHFLTYSLWLAIYNCGVYRDIAETMVRNTNDEKLKEVVVSPSWALFNYWKSMSPNLKEQSCETGQYSLQIWGGLNAETA